MFTFFIFVLILILALINIISPTISQVQSYSLNDNVKTKYAYLTHHHTIIMILQNNTIIESSLSNDLLSFIQQPPLLFHHQLINISIIRKKIDHINNALEYVMANSTHLSHLIFNQSTKALVNQHIISIYSLIIDIEFSTDSVLFSQQNLYITVLKNGAIFQRKLLSQKIIQIQFSFQNQSYLLGTDTGKILSFNSKFPNEENLYAYFNFEQLISNSLFDVTSNNISTIIQTGFSLSNTQGQRGKFGVFRPQFNSIFVPTFHHFVSSFTHCMWFKTYDLNLQRQILVSDDGTALIGGYGIGISYFNAGDIIFWIWGKTNNVLIVQNTIANDTLYFGCFVYDHQNSQRKIYLNGVLISQINPDLGIPLAGIESFMIGTQYVVNDNRQDSFYGQIDEVMTYNIALSPQSIKQLYERNSKELAVLNPSSQFIYDSKSISLFVITNIQYDLSDSSFNSIKTFIGTSSGIIYQFNSNLLFSNTSQINFIQTNVFSLSKASPLSLSLPIIPFSQQNSTFFIAAAQRHLYQISVQSYQYLDIKQQRQFFQNIVLSDIQNFYFLSVEISSSKIKKFKIDRKIHCFQSCNECESLLNQSSCLSCSIFANQYASEQNNSYIKCLYDCPDHYNSINGKCIQRNSFVQSSSTVLSTIFSIPALRITFQAFSSLYIVLEDLWFYRYHTFQYSEYIETVFAESQRINEQKIIPSFYSENLKNIFQQNINKLVNKSSITYEEFVPFPYKKVHIQNVGILFNVSLMIISTLAHCFAIIVLMFLIAKILEKIVSEKSCLNIFIEMIFCKANFYTYIASNIQTNLIVLSFYCFIQLHCNFFMNFSEKINIFTNLIILWIVIVYSLCFYFICSQYCTKNIGKSLLAYRQWKFNSFLQAFYINSLKQLINGFIHGYLCGQYLLQVILLTIVNGFQTIVVIYYSKCFQYKIGALFLGSYYLFFTLLDIVFIIQYFKNIFFIQNVSHYMQVSLTIGLFSVVILLFLMEIYNYVVQIKSKCFNNSIRDDKTQKTNKNIQNKTIKQDNQIFQKNSNKSSKVQQDKKIWKNLKKIKQRKKAIKGQKKIEVNTQNLFSINLDNQLQNNFDIKQIKVNFENTYKYQNKSVNFIGIKAGKTMQQNIENNIDKVEQIVQKSKKQIKIKKNKDLSLKEQQQKKLKLNYKHYIQEYMMILKK